MIQRLPAAALIVIFAVQAALAQTTTQGPDQKALAAQLKTADDNGAEIERALQDVREDCRDGMTFLVSYMPKRDLNTLTADFLITNVEAAYDQWKSVKWKDQVPREIFLNYVLPYASINEGRDNWRIDFQKRFGSLLADANSPGHAGAILNQKIFKSLNVKYSTKRRRADQAPYESIESGLASCTGLSILLIDACRANGVPARFVGTPLWSDRSGNHSWVEIWNNDGWHFTGAAEASGDQLDKAWFTTRASKAQRDERMHAIYAISFKHTPITFPMVWNRSINDIYAVNVTDRYTTKKLDIPAGHASIMFVARKAGEQERCEARLTITDETGVTLFSGKTRDGRFDTNDHLIAVVPMGKTLSVTATADGMTCSQPFKVDRDGQLTELELSKD